MVNPLGEIIFYKKIPAAWKQRVIKGTETRCSGQSVMTSVVDSSQSKTNRSLVSR